jgi:hypothetical protein
MTIIADIEIWPVPSLSPSPNVNSQSAISERFSGSDHDATLNEGNSQ